MLVGVPDAGMRSEGEIDGNYRLHASLVMWGCLWLLVARSRVSRSGAQIPREGIMPTGHYRINLKTRDGELIHESDLDGALPDVVLRSGIFYVRAGISEGRAIYITAAVLAMDEVPA